MARKDNNPTLVQLTQLLGKPEYWPVFGSDPAFVALVDQARAAAALADDDSGRVYALREAAAALTEFLLARVEGAGLVVEHAHGILHSDDMRPVWDPATSTMGAERKPLHLHLVVKFASREKSAPLPQLAGLFGVEPQYLEIGRRGGRAVEACGCTLSQSHDNMLAYLIHIKYGDKYQYPPAQVASVRGLDYVAYHRERFEAWRAGRAHVVAKRADEELEGLRARVLAGELTKEQVLLTDGLYEVYSRHQRVIDDAFDAYGQRRAMRAAAKLRSGDFSTQVIYVHGPAGTGKTRFASMLIDAAIGQAAQHGERWDMYRAATTNPLDDWRGEEVVLLDDTRASAMDANDWLLLLDPYNASPARARYRNKQAVAPRLIVITSPIEPVEFFFYARKKGDVDEAVDQFIRRLASIVRVFREDDMVRFLVQRVGPVDEYQRVITTGSRYARETEVLHLGYGAISEIEHSAGGAVAGVLMSLPEYSRDLPWHASKAWGDMNTLAQIEAGER